MSDIIHAVIADDHPLLLKGLKQVLEAEPDFEVVAEAVDGESALAAILQHTPHVAVLDLDMPKLDGFAVLRETQRNGLATRVVILTIHAEVDLLQKAMDLGASGYVLKQSALTEIVDAIRSVAAGRPFVSASMTPALLDHRARVQTLHRSVPGLALLSRSERRVLALIAEGRSTKEIAQELGIQYRTVDAHRAHICQKLTLSGPNALLRFALEHKPLLPG